MSGRSRPAPCGRPELLAALAVSCLACATYGGAPTDLDRVDPSLQAIADRPSLVVSDTLEALIAEGKDRVEDREFAYWIVARRGDPHTASDAFARAACAGRIAELRGLNAGKFVREVEDFSRLSARLEPAFRDGAAQRMLATLYVLAPAFMVSHGDSETGLELLLDLVERWPDEPDNHLRLAEAYIELGDSTPAEPHLCFAHAHQHRLRPDHRALLSRLFEAAGAPKCSTETRSSE